MPPKNVIDKLLALEDEVNELTLEHVEMRAMSHALAHLRSAVGEVERQARHDALPLTPKKQLWKDREDAAQAENLRRKAAARAEQQAREAEAHEAGVARRHEVLAKRAKVGRA